MATFRSKYTNDEIEAILDRAKVQDTVPFVMYYDSANKLYRFFPDTDKRDAWVAATEAGEMTSEIAAYEFTLNFAAPAPYKLNITLDTDTKYNIPYGTTGNYLNFTFATFADGASSPTEETVDIYFTFKSGSTSTQFSKVYNYGTDVSINMDSYLELGTNSVTILVNGRSTGATNTLVVNFNVVQLEISSTFDISEAHAAYETINVTYTVKGSRAKTINIWIDGGNPVRTDSVSDLQSEKTITDALDGLAPGKHTLQIQASNDISNFYSTLLYYEFVVTGTEQTVALIENEFPSSQTRFNGVAPGLTGEQYVATTINWAYYSSEQSKYNATITWILYTEGGERTTIATRKADIIETNVGVMPDPLTFIPTEYGDYTLQAIMEDEDGDVEISGVKYTIIGTFTISVVKNTAGIEENTSGMTMKLMGLGRSNDEPDETIETWTSTYLGNTYSTTFYNMPWNSNSGWNEDALWLNSGSYCTIDNSPFSEKIAPQSRNGMVFEIDFETFNIDDDDAEVVRIGQETGMSLVITANKATLKSSSGVTMSLNFKSDERVKLAFMVEPNSTGSYKQMMFIMSNGVLSQGKKYGVSDTFVTDDIIHLGNSDGLAGIKIYYIRTYSIVYSMYDGLTNYIIDSGSDIASLVTKNDIYKTGTHNIDFDKLTANIATVKITADVQSMIDTDSKVTVYGPMEVSIPNNPDLSFYCSNAQFSNAGQSTLGLPVPSMHVKLDKNGNQCYKTQDDSAIVKNRWAFRDGNVPEKKFRLQANYMESSGCHNGSFFRLFNQVAPKVQVDGNFVLRTPAQELVMRTDTSSYTSIMTEKWGTKFPNADFSFPYTMNMVPDSIPAVVIWRPDETSSWRFLGQYVIMEEKKASYAGCQHSIYDTIDANGNVDPFEFSTKGGTTKQKLWDNNDCMQFEILRSSEDLTLFLDDSNWSTSTREYAFELEYPDTDDLTESEIEQCWSYFHDEFVSPVIKCRTAEDPQAEFDKLYVSGLFDRWQWAAYYCLMLRNCCVDSSVRNMEITTYKTTTDTSGKTVHVWLPKWWDNDMQCGVQQSGECNIQPRADRSTVIEGSKAFAFAGRSFNEDGSIRSSWLWDALEGCEQFMSDVKTIDEQLYQCSWRYKTMTNIQDSEYIDAWSEALYNESGVVKYINYDHLLNLQGDRTSHRHWFLRTNYNYYDAKNVCGEYKGLASHFRLTGNTTGHKMTFKAAAASYFGYGTTQNIISSGEYHEKGEYLDFVINSDLVYNDPIQLYSSSNYEEIDLSNIARYLYSDINFLNTYDQVNGSKLKILDVGIPMSDMVASSDLSGGIFNVNTAVGDAFYIDGTHEDDDGNVTTYLMNRLEKFVINGLYSIVSLDISGLTSLKKYYAVGTNITIFNPAEGVSLTDVKLPTTILSIQANGCSFSDTNGDCTIEWWETITKTVTDSTGTVSTTPWSIKETSIPYTINEIRMTAMGSDSGARKMFINWIRAVSEYAESQTNPSDVYASKMYTVSDVNWLDFEIDDLLKMAKIPSGNRTLTGYIKCNTELTSEQMNVLMDAFGENIFTITNNLSIDCDSTNIIVSATGSDTSVVKESLYVDGEWRDYDVVNIKQGSTATFKSIGFPIVNSGTTYTWGMYSDYSDSNSDKTLGTSAVPEIYFGYSEGSHVFNYIEYDSGLLVTEECCSNEDLYYRVYVRGSNSGTGNLFIKVTQRTYPTSAYIGITSTPKPTKLNNSYQILNVGTYLIDSGFTPDGYDGTLSSENGGTWSITGYNDEYISRISAGSSDSLGEFERYKLLVKKLPYDEYPITVGYSSTWKNGTVLYADPLKITLIGNIDGVLTSDLNNPMFKAINAFGVSHSSPYSYTSYELKQAKGSIHMKDLLTTASVTIGSFNSVYNGEFNVLNYLRNITELDFSGCTGLVSDIVISGMTNFTILNLYGSSANVDIGEDTSLTSLYFGSPTKIEIVNPSNSLSSSNVNIQSSANLGSLKIVGMSDGESFWLASSLLSGDGGYGNLTSIYVSQSSTIPDAVQGYDIERFASILRLRGSKLTSKFMSGTIKAEHMYEDSKNLLESTFSTNSTGKLSVSLADGLKSTAYYVRWNDENFLTQLSDPDYALGGDGIGITYEKAYKISLLGSALQNQPDIHDLSDLYICKILTFPDCASHTNSEFSGCTGITKIRFPEAVTLIGTNTFANLSNLSELSFENCVHLSTINDNAFSNCTGSVKKVDLSPCVSLTNADISGLVNAQDVVANALTVFSKLII